jgi:tRNA nucleotidyltransferase/poly(A) polymerase
MREVLKKLERTTSASLFYSGEYARDILRRKPTDNVEIVVKNLPLEDVADFFKKYYKDVYVDKYAGAVLIGANKKNLAVYLPRKGRKPSPSATLKEDAKERIFTFNAMYLPVAYQNRLKSLIDPYSPQDPKHDS